MEMIQTFESTVSADTSPHAIHVFVVPDRAFAEGERSSPMQLVKSLDLVLVQAVRPSELVPALAQLLDPELQKHEGVERLMSALRPTPLAPPPLPPPAPAPPLAGPPAGPTPSVTLSPMPSDTWAFAERVAFERLIPFEESPLQLESLAALVTKASAVSVGAYAGFVIAGGTPLLLVTVPAGMIIFGAASGVAKALEEGLRARILKALKGQR